MAARPSNIGIKAIELYFPSQVHYFHSLRMRQASSPRHASRLLQHPLTSLSAVR